MNGHGPASAIGGELLSTSVKKLLLDRIMSGHYEPGERIIELQLSKELGTSQSPVREALRDLAAIGIVTIHSRRGARVRLPTSKELADISLVRSEIDALAATLAAPLLDEEVLGGLREAYAEMERHQADGNHVALTQADAEFHRIIATTLRQPGDPPRLRPARAVRPDLHHADPADGRRQVDHRRAPGDPRGARAAGGGRGRATRPPAPAQRRRPAPRVLRGRGAGGRGRDRRRLSAVLDGFPGPPLGSTNRLSEISPGVRRAGRAEGLVDHG